MNTLLAYCLWMSVRGKSYGRPIWIGIWLLWSEAAAGWDFCLNTCESGDRETGISPVTRTWPTESSSKIKELFLFKTSAYLVQADGIYNLKNAYVANFAFCPPCFKNKFKIHSFQWMADYFLWFLSLWQMFLSYFLAVTVLLPCAGCIVPVCFLIIMVRTDGNLQPATGVSVLLWCLRHSAAVKDGACLHQLQWSFTCLQKDPNHLLAIYICQYTAKNKQQTAHGWQPFLFLEVRHFWHLWMEVGSFFWKKMVSVYPWSKPAVLPAQLSHLSRAQTQNHTQSTGWVKCGTANTPQLPLLTDWETPTSQRFIQNKYFIHDVFFYLH